MSDKVSFLLVVCGLSLGCFITFTVYYVTGIGGNSSVATVLPIASSSYEGGENGDSWLVVNKTMMTINQLQLEKHNLQSKLEEINTRLDVSQKELAKIKKSSPAKSSPTKKKKKNEAQSKRPIPVPTKVASNTKGIYTPLSNTCKYDFKVYVYDIPQSLNSIRISEEARRNQTLHVCQKCILEQFALEYIVYDFFTQFCGRTHNPSEADFFYLPLIRDAEFRWSMQQKGIRARAPSNAEEAILLMIEKGDSRLWNETFKVTDEYYKKSGGGDHIIVMPAPVTNLRHQSSQRGFFHYMIHLHTPIFLGLEYTISFVKEYPICATEKNIVVPYPTTDPDLYNGNFGHLDSGKDRSYLFYYTGGVHGDCVEIRKAMKQLVANSSKTKLDNSDSLRGLCPPSVGKGQAQREKGFQAATFCPIPIGDSPSSKRMYDALNFGCIPVVLSDDLVWAFSAQTGGSLNISTFSIPIPQSIVQFTASKTLETYRESKSEMGILPSGTLIYDLLEQSVRTGGEYIAGSFINPLVQILKKIPYNDIKYLQRHIQEVAAHMRYYRLNKAMGSIPTSRHTLPDGGAIDMLSQLLSTRKRVGLKVVQERCQAERLRTGHKYVSRFSCNGDKTSSLVKRTR